MMYCIHVVVFIMRLSPIGNYENYQLSYLLTIAYQ